MITSYHRLVPHKQVIWCTDLTKAAQATCLFPDNLVVQRFYSIDEMGKEDLKMLMESHSDLMGSASSIIIPDRFNKKAVLWLLKIDGRLAGYRWTIANNHSTPTYFPHTETDVHSIDVEIFSDFRGQHILQYFKAIVEDTLRKEGFKRHYSETYLWNRHAVKAILKTGLMTMGIATRFSIFGKNIVIWHEMSDKIKFTSL